jgi:hypothetical protein
MDNVKSLLKAAAKQYNKLLPHHDHCQKLVVAAHAKLHAETDYGNYGSFAGRPPVLYNVFSIDQNVSRPVRPDIFIYDPEEFNVSYNYLIDLLNSRPSEWSDSEIILANQVVYSAVMSVACCYDIWQRSSRKTPGTFFEILMASLLKQMLPDAVFSKHIPLAALLHDPEVAEGVTSDGEVDVEADNADDEGSNVATDLVIGIPPHGGGIVVPLKITTRERIVQPFAHQRILDSAFGDGVYQSLLVCISETQLDDKTRSVKQVCVPGTVKLFQKYLAPMSGLYYCDVPQRYAAGDMQRIIPVRSVGNFFKDLNDLFESHRANAN